MQEGDTSHANTESDILSLSSEWKPYPPPKTFECPEQESETAECDQNGEELFHNGNELR